MRRVTADEAVRAASPRLAIVEAGAAAIAIFDVERTRAAALAERVAQAFPA